jgi:glycosyltransferase involved in cell wall biosynthesis
LEPIRVLQIVPNMQSGGLENFIMNVYRNIDRSKVQFDFLVHYQKRYFFDDEIEHLGGKIFRLSVREDHNVLKYLRDLHCFFQKHPEYRVVHGHMASLAMFYLSEAKKNGIPVRIVHSHNTATENCLKGRCKNILLQFADCSANVRFACSDEAGEFLFKGKNFTVVPNAIDPAKFAFHPDVRTSARKELGLEGKFVIGHAGRFCLQKNHMFLIDVFSEIHKINPDAVLLLIGEGETERQVHQKVESLSLSPFVRFLGVRADMNRLYQAMDVFLFPSLFEGLGIVTVEAQASGLNTFASDKVPREAKVTNLIRYLSLDASPEQWAEEILAAAPNENREEAYRSLKGTQYDIHCLSQQLEEFYLSAYRERENVAVRCSLFQ